MTLTIKHPTLENYNLNLEGLIGPENAVFHRGRVISKNEISLPEYWENLVEETSISVHLTPVGSHQHIIVKRIGDNKVYLQSHLLIWDHKLIFLMLMIFIYKN